MEHAACPGRRGQKQQQQYGQQQQWQQQQQWRQQQQQQQQQQHESRSSRHSHRRICRHSDSNVRSRMTFYSNQFVQTETMFLRVFTSYQSRIMISGPELMTLGQTLAASCNLVDHSSTKHSFIYFDH